MIKDFILGLNDYLNDIVHDSMIKDAKKLGSRLQDEVTTFNSKTKKKTTKWIDAVSRKEGNLWHYIQQRRISRQYKKGKKTC